MTEKLTMKKLAGELETLRKQVLDLEQQHEHKLKVALEKAIARLGVGTEPTNLPEHGISIDAGHRQRLIAEEAYLIAERRGFQGGDEAQDWASAEKEINHRLMQEAILGKSATSTKSPVTKKPAAKKPAAKKAGAKPSSRAK
ncbi:MAG: DUF2934 domain-containing protein [Gammaproteobacteria bacterium]